MNKAGYKSCFLLVLVVCAFEAYGGVVDVNSVLMRGDSADYGMWINFVKEYDYGFKVITTGAEFMFDNQTSTLKMHQRIGAQRLVGQITLGKGPQEIKMCANTPDHVLFEATDFFMGIYGDSVCIIAAKADGMPIKCLGNFVPEYAGQRLGEVIFIDDLGGGSVLPQRHEAGYELLEMKRFRKDWRLSYKFRAGQRLMLGVFPPREFNWEQSFRDRVVFCNGATKNGISTGQLVDDETIRSWRKYVNVMVIFNGGLYHGRNDWKDYVYPGKAYRYSCGGPYVPVQPSELKRVVTTAHSVGFKVLVYVSPFYHYKSFDADAFFDDAERIYKTYDLDGFYIDGMYMDWSQGSKCKDNKIVNYEIIRRLRKLVGPEGILFYHGSGDRSEVAAIPNIDALCDFVLYGETVHFETLHDEYIRFQVRKFGISNTIGMIKPNKRPKDMSLNEILDEMLRINNRARWWSTCSRIDSRGRRIWTKVPPPELLRYYLKLNELQAKFE